MASGSGLSDRELERVLEALAARGLVFVGPAPAGERGYALLQSGFGLFQVFFWSGVESEHARKMAAMVTKYWTRELLRDMYAAAETEPYRYIPGSQSLSQDLQAVLPAHCMTSVLEAASSFAVAHCACRVDSGLRGHPCPHPLEVCISLTSLLILSSRRASDDESLAMRLEPSLRGQRRRGWFTSLTMR